ncbi:MAG: right-handed parallel beta-helix repeat-containing protein, partial [Alphaproteobacteria bacterium]|nr:right-handed parallel beta-helix repeat-containing protein [Alphaproteobacteria bacterium]
GNYGHVTVTHSRFEAGRGGQYFKSRAARNDVTDNLFDDSHGHLTNYMIDLCAGSVGTVARNHIIQGGDKENHSALIAVAAESRDHSSAGLVITNNVANYAPGPNAGQWTVFVADWSHQPLRISANSFDHRMKPFETR